MALSSPKSFLVKLKFSSSYYTAGGRLVNCWTSMGNGLQTLIGVKTTVLKLYSIDY